MAGLVYGLCTIMALICAFLLLRSFSLHKHRLLLWSGLCFIGLSINNFLLVMDHLLTNVDLSILRLVPAILGMLLLVYGLILEEN